MSTLIPILDTHQHLIYPERWPYSWTIDIPALAGKAFRLEDYSQLTADKGVVGSLFMETSPDDPHWRDETRFVLTLAEKPGSLIKGVIANCRPEEEGFRKDIESIQHPKLLGFRRILHVMPDALSQTERFAEHLRWLGTRKLTFDLCFLARQLPLAEALADKAPLTQFILDHCGVPDIAAGSFTDWKLAISSVAQRANVACKISGLLAYCKPANATLDAVKPYVMHCIEAFGPDRLVWGSDWPVCVITAGLREWIDITRSLIAAFTEAEQRKLLIENAVRIYRVPGMPAVHQPG